jgi:uncharacterized protein (TIGR02118 family)
MPRLVVLYNQPEDPAAFDRHYTEVHEPIVRRYPNITSFTTTRPEGVGGRPSPFYLMAEIAFATDADLQEALRSEAGAESAKDLRNFATAGVALFIAPDA